MAGLPDRVHDVASGAARRDPGHVSSSREARYDIVDRDGGDVARDDNVRHASATRAHREGAYRGSAGCGHSNGDTACRDRCTRETARRNIACYGLSDREGACRGRVGPSRRACRGTIDHG